MLMGVGNLTELTDVVAPACAGVPPPGGLFTSCAWTFATRLRLEAGVPRYTS